MIMKMKYKNTNKTKEKKKTIVFWTVNFTLADIVG